MHGDDPMKRGHWWLTDEEGNIVDPTAGQFPIIVRYEPWSDGDPIRLGKCRNCGKEVWGVPELDELSGFVSNEKSFCDEHCYEAYGAYLNKNIRRF